MTTERQGQDRLPLDDAEVEAYAERRQALHTALVGVDGELDGLATQQDPDRDRLAAAVRSLRDAVADHVREADAPDGLLAQILSDAPWFAARVQRLRDDHEQLMERATALIDDVTTDRPVGELLPEARLLSTHISEHRHAGTDLLMDAYMLDIPAGD